MAIIVYCSRQDGLFFSYLLKPINIIDENEIGPLISIEQHKPTNLYKRFQIYLNNKKGSEARSFAKTRCLPGGGPLVSGYHRHLKNHLYKKLPKEWQHIRYSS